MSNVRVVGPPKKNFMPLFCKLFACLFLEHDSPKFHSEIKKI